MNSGCSSRQAVHHEAKTLISETSPWRSSLDKPSVRPWTGGKANSGTGLPIKTEGSSPGSRVRPQASATASAMKRVTGSRKTRRFRDFRVSSFGWTRSEEHTSELQSLMRISYAVFCLKKKLETHQ